jgi:GntR family transcriptional regulator
VPIADETLCHRIANDLRTSIHCGDYLPGQRVPSGRTLMRKYGVARQTVQNAFDVLRGEGLIVTRPGSGTFVRDRPAVVRLARSTRHADALAAPAVTRTEPADEYSADALGLSPGDEVCVREHVLHADGEPVQLATSRLPMPPRGDIDRFVEYVSTRPARPAEATSLMLSSGAPVLCVTRIAFDSGGTPVEMHDMVLAGTRYELVYEFPAH